MTSPDLSLADAMPGTVGEPPVGAPQETPIELDRLRRNVRAQLFGGLAEPTRIGRFRLLHCIGRGGMGVVWSAHDDELDRTVAIKLLRPELSGLDLTAEARALAKLSHPNVVSVFDVGEHEDLRLGALVREPDPHRLAVDELHRDEALPLVLADVEHRDDVGVRELG
ncbi:MAG: hypothetical protein AAF721_14015, partial [Myxococcota bacterium]